LRRDITNGVGKYRVLTRLKGKDIIIQDLLREIDQSLRIEGGDKLANEVGKRYLCEKCNAEFIVTRAGEGKLACCGQPMTLKK
jgi:desulfoferrodoxin-like iron-binding protein